MTGSSAGTSGTVRTVRRLLPPTEPPGAAVDPVDVAWEPARPAPPERPWVLSNMISSLDGAAAVDGLSGGLGGPADRAMFHALREVPDVILVAAGTVRAEGYRPPDPSPEARARRVAHGRGPVPRLAVVTGSLELDLAAPIFTATESKPIVVTTTSAPEDRRQATAEVADVIATGEGHADLGDVLRRLRAGGTSVVLCEGGPSLLGQLAQDDLLDEVNLTLAPALVCGDAPRIAHSGASGGLRALELDAVCEQDGMLLLRHLRRR